jgi:putative peptidoglycan lipid II flippase
VSALSQALGFLRQLLIAAFFGISRDLDIYLVVFAVANMIVFTFGTIFDSVAVPRLVQLRERDGEEAARALAASVFRLSWLLGGVATLVMLAALPLLAPIVATGFDPAERSDLSHLAWYFLPWLLLCLPYYAAAARHKGKRNFNRVFAAEIVIACISIGYLVLRHAAVADLPLAYGAGYAVGLLVLMPGSGLLRRGSGGRPLRQVLRNIGELFLANQTGSVGVLTDRHFQSLIPPGGIATVNYPAQLVNGLSTLLIFREIFVVPLAEKERRSEKLERLLAGLVLLAVPVVAFSACFAHDVVSILFQRGRFDAAAVNLTAPVFQIYVFVVIPAVITTPLARLFQIIDRIGLIHILYLSSALSLAGFGYLFVSVLGWGAVGVAWMQLLSAIVTCAVTASLTSRFGTVLNWWRIGRYGFFAAVVAGAATLAAIAAASPLDAPLGRLLAGGAAFALVVAGGYFAARAQLRHIIYS